MKNENNGWKYINYLPSKHLPEYQLQKRIAQGIETNDLREALRLHENNRTTIETLKEVFVNHPPVYIQAWRDELSERHTR